MDQEFWEQYKADYPCSYCDVKPSVSEGHGVYICQKCDDERWCPECHYMLNVGHVCKTPEWLAERDRRRSEYEAALQLIEDHERSEFY